MYLLAVNGSPRKNGNTAQLLDKTAAGAASAGAETELVHLRDLNFRGCVSCFLCKKIGGPHYGRCAVSDDLSPLLDKAHRADVIVLGSPIYFGTENSAMRAFMERFCFQYYLYSAKKPPLSPRKKAVLCYHSMNVRREDMAKFGYETHLTISKGVFERLFGSCEQIFCCDTKQFSDYSAYDTDMFDVEAKIKRHQEVFPTELQAAFDAGVRLAAE